MTMTRDGADTEELLARAGRGDVPARQELLARHRARLARMVAVRLDPRLAARVDPSDVVQEALIEADRRLAEYLRGQPLPFYPWLRRLAWERLVKVHQRHLAARRRSVAREERRDPPLPDDSVAELAGLLASGTSPSRRVLLKEVRDRVRAALAALPAADREVLVLRYLEQLPMKEVAAVLGVHEGAAKIRHTRALARLCDRLGGDPRGGEP